MNTYCATCPGRLYPCDIASGLTTCVECARRALHASRRNTRAVVVASQLRDAGQAATSDAHPDDKARVMAAIKALAATGREFSANDCRDLHGISGPIVGAAFTAARKAGLIEAVGFVTSTDPGTHAHPVRTWVGIQQTGAAA